MTMSTISLRNAPALQTKLKLTISNPTGLLQKVGSWINSLYAKEDGTIEPSLILHMYPQHFTIGNDRITHAYTGPLQSLLEAINLQRLPTEFMDLFEQYDCKFYHGCLLVDIYDHRPISLGDVTKEQDDMDVEMQTISRSPLVGCRLKRVVLTPDDSVAWASVELIAEKMVKGAKPMSLDEAQEIHGQILLKMYPDLDLGSDPAIMLTKNLENFDRCKKTLFTPDESMRVFGRKRKHVETVEDGNTIMDYMDSRKGQEFHYTFNLQAFREDWNKKKRMAEDDVMLALDMPNYKQLKKTVRANPQGTLYFNTLKLVRSMRFESKMTLPSKSVHSLLNIYEKPTLYEKTQPTDRDNVQLIAVLRWGSEKDKGDGGLEYYSIGNALAADYYINHFKGFYELQNKCTYDSDNSLKNQKMLQQRQFQQQQVLAAAATSQLQAAKAAANTSTPAVMTPPIDRTRVSMTNVATPPVTGRAVVSGFAPRTQIKQEPRPIGTSGMDMASPPPDSKNLPNVRSHEIVNLLKSTGTTTQLATQTSPLTHSSPVNQSVSTPTMNPVINALNLGNAATSNLLRNLSQTTNANAALRASQVQSLQNLQNLQNVQNQTLQNPLQNLTQQISLAQNQLTQQQLSQQTLQQLTQLNPSNLNNTVNPAQINSTTATLLQLLQGVQQSQQQQLQAQQLQAVQAAQAAQVVQNPLQSILTQGISQGQLRNIISAATSVGVQQSQQIQPPVQQVVRPQQTQLTPQALQNLLLANPQMLQAIVQNQGQQVQSPDANSPLLGTRNTRKK